MLKQPFYSQKMIVSTPARTFKTFGQNPLTHSFFMSSHSSTLDYFGHILSLFLPVSREKLPILTTKVTTCDLSYVWVSPMVPIYILSVFPSAGSFPSLCNHVNYLWPGDHVVHAPSARSRPKCSLLFISIFLSVGMPPAHSVLFITQLFLNFSPSYSLTSHKSGFPPQRFHFYCTSSQSC